MDFESSEIFHHKTRTKSCNRSANADLTAHSYQDSSSDFKKYNRDDFKFSLSKNQNPLLFHRSNSISIPISKQQKTSNESTYSKSYNCDHCDYPNYGAIDEENQSDVPTVTSILFYYNFNLKICILYST